MYYVKHYDKIVKALANLESAGSLAFERTKSSILDQLSINLSVVNKDFADVSKIIIISDLSSGIPIVEDLNQAESLVHTLQELPVDPITTEVNIKFSNM